jgi:two-component system, OmpR family, response regulator
MSIKTYLMLDQRSVLIIDDESDLCQLLKSYLMRKNYDVHIAHTLEDGMNIVKTLHPSMVFLDNNLPDGIGWKLAPFLANEYPDMQINFVSAFDSQVPNMPPASKYTVIEKPISFVDLEQRVFGVA